MTAQEAYILAKAYTNKSIEGAGSLKGAACQIKSIEAITGGHRITFEWEDNDGEVSTDTMDVMDGANGSDGVGISSIAYKETDAHGNYVYTVTLTDTNTYDIICPKGAQGETGETGATGNGIASIEKTGTAGLVDTYTITYTNGQSATFTVTNGESITVDSAMSGSSTNPVQNKVITEALADKQDAEDNNLTTTSKTVVGAINEHEGDIGTLKSGLTTLDNEVNGDATTYPYADVITIEDAVPANVADCSVKIEPVQDLHGQSAPWVGGAGKNKLPLTVDGIKAANTTGTWNGNAYTDSGVTFTINTDSDGNVVSITEDGTASGTAARLFIPIPESQINLNTSYILTGTPSGGSANTYRSYISNQSGEIFWDYGNGVTFSFTSYGQSTGIVAAVTLADYATVSGKTFYPMIRLATETDATFAPYTNICPISGHTEASVVDEGKNLWPFGDLHNVILTDVSFALKAGTYVLSKKGSNMGVRFFYDNSESIAVQLDNIDSDTFVLTNDVVKINYACNPGTATHIQLERGSAPTAYTPYVSPHTATIALGDTRYGGVLDVDSGAYSDFGGMADENGFSYGGEQTSAGGLHWCDYAVAEVAHGGISNMLPKETSAWDKTYPCVNFQTDKIRIYGNFTSLAEFKEQYSGLQVYYQKATPTTIQLTPQQIQLLKGTNTLTASTGQISVTANGVSGAIGAVQEQVNATDEALAELAAQLPTAPTTDGSYVLTVTVADGTPTYSWVSTT